MNCSISKLIRSYGDRPVKAEKIAEILRERYGINMDVRSLSERIKLIRNDVSLPA